VTTGKTYLIRAISASALSWYNITIPQHNVTIVEVQGSYVNPLVVDAVVLNSGERMAFLLTANNPGCYEVGISMLARAGPDGAAYLQYDNLNCTALGYIAHNSSSVFNPNLLETQQSSTLPSANRTITVPIQQIMNDATGGIKWTIGGISAMLNSATPFLFSNYYGLASDTPDSYIIDVTPGEVIDLIFQNTNRTWDNTQEQHSIHVHGHAYWVLGSGLGFGNASEYPPSLNLVNPVKVDTFTLPAYGWLHVRIVANNPGVWMVHCHVSFHMSSGLFFFLRYPENSIPAPPPGFPYCGDAETALLARLNTTRDA